jgi:NAD(P)H-hydrate repair Nnr-like enzyme with NAD(P)H-hydrate dehydratase domain
MDTLWQKQASSKPLFDDLLWSRPEQKALAGKLLIIGGNSHAIAAPGEAFMLASKAGAGDIRVVSTG